MFICYESSGVNSRAIPNLVRKPLKKYRRLVSKQSETLKSDLKQLTDDLIYYNFPTDIFYAWVNQTHRDESRLVGLFLDLFHKRSLFFWKSAFPLQTGVGGNTRRKLSTANLVTRVIFENIHVRQQTSF